VPQHKSLFKAIAVLKVFPFSQVYLGHYSAKNDGIVKLLVRSLQTSASLESLEHFILRWVGNTIKKANDCAN